MNIDILMYHGFTDKDHHEGIENHSGKHLHIKKFDEQVRFLKKNYNIVSLNDVLDYYTQGKKLPPRSIVITVDDGYKSNWTLAYPVLKEYQVPATVFVATDFIDQKQALWVDRIEYGIDKTQQKSVELDVGHHNCKYILGSLKEKERADAQIKQILKSLPLKEREQAIQSLEAQLKIALRFSGIPEMYAPLTWENIRAMQDSGLITIGSHTCSHTILTSCSHDDLLLEITASKKRIEDMLSHACDHFSYPNGGKGDFNDTTHHALSKALYRSAMVTVIGTNNELANCYELKRLNVHNSGEMGGFKRTLSPFARFLRLVQKWKYV